MIAIPQSPEAIRSIRRTPLGRALPNDDVMLSEAKHLCLYLRDRSKRDPRFFASLRMTFQTLCSNLSTRHVFDLPVAHLHPLIALPIITKFLA